MPLSHPYQKRSALNEIEAREPRGDLPFENRRRATNLVASTQVPRHRDLHPNFWYAGEQFPGCCSHDVPALVDLLGCAPGICWHVARRSLSSSCESFADLNPISKSLFQRPSIAAQTRLVLNHQAETKLFSNSVPLRYVELSRCFSRVVPRNIANVSDLKARSVRLSRLAHLSQRFGALGGNGWGSNKT
jgi:hypothetical protein